MYEDRVEIISPGALYGTNKLEKLGTDNIMEVRNPTIVRILEEKGSVIENRHSGIPTMKREMRKYNLPEPEFYEERGSFKVIFRNSFGLAYEQTDKYIDQYIEKQLVKHQTDLLKKYQDSVLKYCITPKSAKEIRNFLNLKSRHYVNNKILKPLIDLNLLEYTNKNHVRSSNQKYIAKK